MTSVVQAIAAVMGELPAVGKDGRASGKGGSYPYRSIDGVMNALQPLLAKHQVVIVPRVTNYEETETGGWGHCTRLTVEYEVFGPDGDSVTVIGVGEGIDNSDKGPGKAMSYAYKAAISQLFCLRTDDPLMDNEASDGERPAQPRSGGTQTITRAQYNEIKEVFAGVENYDLRATLLQNFGALLKDTDGVTGTKILPERFDYWIGYAKEAVAEVNSQADPFLEDDEQPDLKGAPDVE